MDRKPHDPRQDEVDEIVQAWELQRPDFDASPLAIFSRTLRLNRHFERLRKATFLKHGLEVWEFEMLAALRRAGDPHSLTAGALMQETLVSSGTITNRIDRMEQHGYVKRGQDPTDGRVVVVTATKVGLDKVDAAMKDLLIVEDGLLAPFTDAERKAFASYFRRLIEPLEEEK